MIDINAMRKDLNDLKADYEFNKRKLEDAKVQKENAINKLISQVHSIEDQGLKKVVDTFLSDNTLETRTILLEYIDAKIKEMKSC